MSRFDISILDTVLVWRQVESTLKYFHGIETDAQRPITIDPRTRRQTPYPPKQLREQVIPEWTREVLRLQKQRKSLPPLPKFPDADLIRALLEAQERHPDPEEKDQDDLPESQE